MTEVLPNWNLKDFYLSIEDKQINKDLELFKQFTINFSEKYKDRLLSHASDFEKIIQVYEDGNELGDKLGNYAFLIYATNMNDQKTVQFYQGINEKLTEISSDLIFFTNEINSMLGYSESEIFKVSAKTGEGVEDLIKEIDDNDLDLSLIHI